MKHFEVQLRGAEAPKPMPERNLGDAKKTSRFAVGDIVAASRSPNVYYRVKQVLTKREKPRFILGYWFPITHFAPVIADMDGFVCRLRAIRNVPGRNDELVMAEFTSHGALMTECAVVCHSSLECERSQVRYQPYVNDETSFNTLKRREISIPSPTRDGSPGLTVMEEFAGVKEAGSLFIHPAGCEEVFAIGDYVLVTRGGLAGEKGRIRSISTDGSLIVDLSAGFQRIYGHGEIALDNSYYNQFDAAAPEHEKITETEVELS